MSQTEIKERIALRSQVLEWLKDCFRSHLNDSDPAMRNGFACDIASIAKEHEKDLALVV